MNCKLESLLGWKEMSIMREWSSDKRTILRSDGLWKSAVNYSSGTAKQVYNERLETGSSLNLIFRSPGRERLLLLSPPFSLFKYHFILFLSSKLDWF
jgi:hypothetical protein